MLEVLTDVQGVLIAAAIIYAAKELRRISNALHDLDHRVSSVERVLKSTGVSGDERRPRRP